MHNGLLQVNGEKMSKSLGNFVTIRELLEKLPGDVLRLQMLMTHYRQPIDWTGSITERAKAELEEWANVVWPHYQRQQPETPDEIIEALSDDLNTPNAITALRGLFSKAKTGGTDDILRFSAACHFFGFNSLDRPGVFQSAISGINIGRSWGNSKIMSAACAPQWRMVRPIHNAKRSLRKFGLKVLTLWWTISVDS